MTTAKVGHATAVKVAKVIAQFLDFTSDVDAFGETYPFIRRDLRGRSLGAVAKAWTITVIVLSVYIGFFAAKKIRRARVCARSYVESVDVAHKSVCNENI